MIGSTSQAAGKGADRCILCIGVLHEVITGLLVGRLKYYSYLVFV